MDYDHRESFTVAQVAFAKLVLDIFGTIPFLVKKTQEQTHVGVLNVEGFYQRYCLLYARFGSQNYQFVLY